MKFPPEAAREIEAYHHRQDNLAVQTAWLTTLPPAILAKFSLAKAQEPYVDEEEQYGGTNAYTDHFGGLYVSYEVQRSVVEHVIRRFAALRQEKPEQDLQLHARIAMMESPLQLSTEQFRNVLARMAAEERIARARPSLDRSITTIAEPLPVRAASCHALPDPGSPALETDNWIWQNGHLIMV